MNYNVDICELASIGDSIRKLVTVTDENNKIIAKWTLVNEDVVEVIVDTESGKFLGFIPYTRAEATLVKKPTEPRDTTEIRKRSMNNLADARDVEKLQEDMKRNGEQIDYAFDQLEKRVEKLESSVILDKAIARAIKLDNVEMLKELNRMAAGVVTTKID